MRLLISWLRDFVDISAPAADIAETLALRGFEVASIEPAPAGVRPPWQAADTPGDAVIDFEVTANRPDCLSVIGLAREVATAYKRPFRGPSADPGALLPLAPLTSGHSDAVRVTIEDTESCPRYAAAVADISGAASPPWLAARLLAAGVRPISAIVDVTNYVLIELGQPMHAFDLSKLAGPELRIRGARAGETITTLDGVARKLEPGMLVIADAARPQAVAGVMGGADSEVSGATRRVVFESAYFAPAGVRRTSRRLALKTEASARFERGADINASVVALERAAALLAAIGAGAVRPPVIDRYPQPRAAVRLTLRRERLAALLGIDVPDEDVERILRGLGLAVTRAPGGWHVVVPTFRVDLQREVDLVEEVGRHYGFDRIPSTFPPLTVAAPPPDPRIPRDRLVRRVLTGAGLSEAVTFGFIESKAVDLFQPSERGGSAAIENPLSGKFAVLRPSLLPGLVDAVAHNRRHGRRDVRLFEIGARFAPPAGETRGVAIACTGLAASEHWADRGREVDFFDAKGLLEAVAGALDVALTFEPAREPFLVPGQTASVKVAAGPRRGVLLGVVGQLAPAVADARGLPRQDRVFVGELDLDGLWYARTERSDAVASLPRHPAVVRDLSIIVGDALPAAIIRGTIQAAGAATAAPLASAAFFDRYQGKGVPEGSVSVSVRLTFQSPDRTLTDAEVQQSVDTILSALVREHGAALR